jgi:hypothetical protein
MPVLDLGTNQSSCWKGRAVNKVFIVLGKILFGGAAVKTETGFGVLFGLVMFVWALVDIYSFFFG